MGMMVICSIGRIVKGKHCCIFVRRATENFKIPRIDNPFLLFSQPHSASVRDEFGKTPLDYAKEDENDISIDLLLFPDETIRNYVEKRKMQFKQREIRELMVSSLYEYVTFEKKTLPK